MASMQRIIPAALLLAATAIAAVAALPPPVGSQEAPPRSEWHGPAATEVDHAKLLDAVAARIDETFVYEEKLRAIDWKARIEAYRERVIAAPSLRQAAAVINTLLAELATSHTNLYTRDDVEYYLLLDVFGGGQGGAELLAQEHWGGGVRYPGIGAFAARIGDRHFVDQVLQGSPAERAGLLVGDEIVAIDGEPYHPLASFRGRVGRRVEVEHRRAADGPLLRTRVPVLALSPLQALDQATRSSARVIQHAGQRFGYMQVWASKTDSAFVDAFAEFGPVRVTRVTRRGVESSRTGPRDRKERPPLDGLIVDMRGKIGGLSSSAVNYLLTLDRPGSWMRFRGRREEPGQPLGLRGRIVVLTDHHTRSTAELFVYGFKRERLGTVIGTTTAGAVSGAVLHVMPGGNLLYVAAARVEVDGVSLEGKGVEPDIRVECPLPYSAGDDPVLAAALRHLAQSAEQPTHSEPAKPAD